MNDTQAADLPQMDQDAAAQLTRLDVRPLLGGAG